MLSMIRRGAASRRQLFSSLSRAGLGLALVLGVFAVLPVPAAQATRGGDPGGNNGTVKIVEDGDFDSIPNNDPHVGCTFTVEWYGFDKGDHIISTVTFKMQAPTQDVGLTVDGPSTVFVGGDSASGAGTPSGLDGRQRYTLSFDGPPHPIQGYHLKLTISTPGSQGNDKKYKVFWVEGCEPPNPSIMMTKSVADSNDADNVGSLGELLTYSFTVTNTGNVPLTNVRITDPLIPALASGAPCVASLAPGASTTCPLLGSATHTVSAADIANGSVHNTATVSGSPPTGANVSAHASATISTPAVPSLRLVKSVADSNDADALASQGEVLTYSFVVTNTGNVPLTNVRITDPLITSLVSGGACVATLAVGASTTCPLITGATHATTAAEVTHGSVDNTATATGSPPTGPNVTAQGSATIPTYPNVAALRMTKSVTDSADADSVGSLGETLTYSFTVTNTGDETLTSVRITDAMIPSLSGGAPCVAVLAAGASTTCPLLPSATHIVSAADIANGSVHNTATSSGTPPTGPDVSAQANASILTPATPGLDLHKTVRDSNDADSIGSLGETLTYTFTVTNTGNVPLTDVRITDSQVAVTGAPCVATLAVGATTTCPLLTGVTHVVTPADMAAGRVDNTAVATGVPPSGPPVTDDDTATIGTESARPSIRMDKQVTDSSDPDTIGSLGEVLTYTFHVINTGNLPLTDVTVSDPLLGISDAPCVSTLAVGATTDCPLLAPLPTHTVTADDVDNGSVDNAATATGVPPQGPPVTSTGHATIPTVSPGNANLSIEKSVDASQAGPGDVVTYWLRVLNTGDAEADDVTVTDHLPSGTTFVSASAPCTNVAQTVTCSFGTVADGDDRTVTIRARVNGTSGLGTDSQQHQLDYTKIESHLALFDHQTGSATTMCPTGYVATDGSVRLDHVDQGVGTFADAVVLLSAPTTDGRGWTGTVRNDTTGQVQAKVNVVCASERTVSGENHSHPLIVTGPVSTNQSLVSGRNIVDLTCAPGSYAITPGFAFTSGEGVVSTRRTPAGWRFLVDVAGTAQATFSVRCLSVTLGSANGHTHDLAFTELSDTVSVPAGQIVERQLTCPVGYKGIVSWATMEPGLLSLGTDPRPITRVFRFYNPTGSDLSAEFGLLCVAIRTGNGSNVPGGTITNTASVTTTSPESSTSDNSDSASFQVNSVGGLVLAPVASISGSGSRISVAITSLTTRGATARLLATGKVKGTKLHAGSLLASSKGKLHAGRHTVRLDARHAAIRALHRGTIRKARLVIITKDGSRKVRVVKLRR